MTISRLLRKRILPTPFGRIVVYWLTLLLTFYLIGWKEKPVVEIRRAKVETEYVRFQQPDVEPVQSVSVKKRRVQVATSKDSVDINNASAEELCILKGIGPVLAGRIVSFRSDNGPFATLEELQKVKGIGPKSVEKLSKQRIKVSR